MLPLAALLGGAIGVAGSLISAGAEVPTGPVIVLVGFGTVLVAILGASGAGRAVAQPAARARAPPRRDRGDAARPGDRRCTPGRRRRSRSSRSPPGARGAARGARCATWIARGCWRASARRGRRRPAEERLHLTAAGAAAAHAALQRRELWTLWLEHGHELELPDAREPDPRDLRGTLGDDYVERLLALDAQRAPVTR